MVLPESVGRIVAELLDHDRISNGLPRSRNRTRPASARVRGPFTPQGGRRGRNQSRSHIRIPRRCACGWLSASRWARLE